MKQLKKDLLAVIRDLKRLSQKTERMTKRLDTLEKSQAPKKPKEKEKAAKKEKKSTVGGTVLDIIMKSRSKNGVNMSTLKQKSDLNTRTIQNAIFGLKKQGKIKSGGKGIYVKA